MSTVFCIHPASKDLRFMDRVIVAIKNVVGAEFSYLRLNNNTQSHTVTIDRLAASPDGLVIVLCHGTDTYIQGSDTDQVSTHDPTPFAYGEFINRDNCHVFRGKHVFCFSCHSNGLAAAALAGGAISFLGFERIRFNYEEHDVRSPTTCRRFSYEVKGRIADVLTAALVPALTRHLPLAEMARRVRAASHQRAIAFVRDSPKHKHRHEMARILSEIGNGGVAVGGSQGPW